MLPVLLGVVWPLLCGSVALVVLVRDRRHRGALVQQADDYAHEAWGYLCDVRALVEEAQDLLVADQPDPDARTDVIRRAMSRTAGQVDRGRGCAGRHSRKDIL